VTPSRIVRVALLLLVVGIVVGVVTDVTALRAAGLAIAGIACVLLVAAAFLAIGLSEDRDRAGGPPPP
jgi:hypothetical protein